MRNIFLFLCLIATISRIDAGQIATAPLLESEGMKPARTIRYVIEPKVLANKALTKSIKNAIQALNNDDRLILNFQEVTDIAPYEYYQYITIKLGDDRSFALNLGTNLFNAPCQNSGPDFLEPTLHLRATASEETIIHEFFHALGLKHEQQRSDRDEFIDIVEEEIAARTTTGPFTSEFGVNYGNAEGCAVGKFDFSSTMLYYARSKEIARRHSTLQNQSLVIQQSAKLQIPIRIRAVDSTDSARDNLTLNYENRVSLGVASISTFPHTVPGVQIDLSSQSAQWRLEQVTEINSAGVAEVIVNTYYISGLSQNYSSLPGVQPRLSVTTQDQLSLVDPTAALTPLEDRYTRWVAIGINGLTYLINDGAQKFLALTPSGPQLVDANNILAGPIILEPVGPSLFPGKKPSSMDILTVNAAYDGYFQLYNDINRNNARYLGLKVHKKTSGSPVTNRKNGAFWRFRFVAETLGNVENNNGYLQIQNHSTGQYLHVNPNTLKAEMYLGAEGKAVFGGDWISSQWLIESNENGEEGFIIRNRLTGKPLSLNGEKADGSEDDKWYFRFTEAHGFFTKET